jgi:hypothetical protein
MDIFPQDLRSIIEEYALDLILAHHRDHTFSFFDGRSWSPAPFNVNFELDRTILCSLSNWRLFEVSFCPWNTVLRQLHTDHKIARSNWGCSSQAAVCVAGDRIFVSGGYADSSLGRAVKGTISLVSDFWELVAIGHLAIPRSGHKMLTDGSYIWILGGHRRNSPIAEIECFNIATKRAEPTITIPSPFFATTACLYDSQIWIFGYGRIQIYDLIKARWHFHPFRSQCPREVAVANNLIYLFGLSPGEDNLVIPIDRENIRWSMFDDQTCDPGQAVVM